MSDEELMRVIVNQCDALDITRLHENVSGKWVTTTIFSSDEALLRIAKAILAARDGK